MIPRHLAPHLKKHSKKYPVVALVGPRQSGKTTLTKELFPGYNYHSLENLHVRKEAMSDPQGFLKRYGPRLIIDEAQRVPDLFPYLQEIVDTYPESHYILTGSSQFLLMEKITQSLAGRVATFRLFPFTYLELMQYEAERGAESIYKVPHTGREKFTQEQLYKMLWMGFYPPIYDRELESDLWYENYLFTYVERDVRSMMQIRNLHLFENFLILCAAHAGQLLNYSSFSNALGVSVGTIKEWISILEASSLIFLLPPYFKNYSKRLVKTPKLYFTDTGLLCHLLSIRNPSQLKNHPLLGSIFETFVIAESYKRFCHLGRKPPLYFWRDQEGHEIDLLIHDGEEGFPVEIKLSQTFQSNDKKNIEQWLALKENTSKKGMVISCGTQVIGAKEAIPCVPWYLL